MADMREDDRHASKVRAAGDRGIDSPGSSPATSPPAQRQVKIISQARHAAKTCCPVGKR